MIWRQDILHQFFYTVPIDPGVQGSENRDGLIERLGLAKFMDAEGDDEDERILEVIYWPSKSSQCTQCTDCVGRCSHALWSLQQDMPRVFNGFRSTYSCF